MKLSIGIVGLPNVGKSTLFNALTRKRVPMENYPFCTIDPSVGVVAVPDERLDLLNDFSKSRKKIPAVIEFVDIAGLVKGAAEGEGLGNQFLSHIRETDAIAQVIRIFEDKNITHVSAQPDPLADLQTINLELILADLQTVTKRLDAIAREVKRGIKEALAEQVELERFKKDLESGQLAVGAPAHLHLLTAKSILYVLNKKAGAKTVDFKPLIKFLTETGSNYVTVDAKVEQELSDLEGEDKKIFREEWGAADDGINDLIKEGYKMLDLITFLTTGEDETRAWTIKRGSTAPEAGAAIHSDFKEKFIKAEVINWQDLLKSGSEANARARGLIRTEGREYIVRDGDVIEFKI